MRSQPSILKAESAGSFSRSGFISSAQRSFTMNAVPEAPLMKDASGNAASASSALAEVRIYQSLLKAPTSATESGPQSSQPMSFLFSRWPEMSMMSATTALAVGRLPAPAP